MKIRKEKYSYIVNRKERSQNRFLKDYRNNNCRERKREREKTYEQYKFSFFLFASLTVYKQKSDRNDIDIQAKQIYKIFKKKEDILYCAR